MTLFVVSMLASLGCLQRNIESAESQELGTNWDDTQSNVSKRRKGRETKNNSGVKFDVKECDSTYDPNTTRDTSVYLGRGTSFSLSALM